MKPRQKFVYWYPNLHIKQHSVFPCNWPYNLQALTTMERTRYLLQPKVSLLLVLYLLPGVLLNIYIRRLLLIFLYLLQTCPDNHLEKWYFPDKMNHLSSTTKLQIFVTEIERLEHALGSLFLCFEIIGSRYTQFENPVIKKKLKLKKVAQYPEA